MNATIIHNKEKNQFETTIDGHTAELKYRKVDDSVYDFYHTGVPKELEGQGIGSALARNALEFAKQNNWKVNPVCPFVKIYIERHSEFQSISI